MKVILYKDIPNLGEEGDVRVVADGYARNYLIPQKMVVRYNRATETELKQKQKLIERHRTEKSLAAADNKTRLQSLFMDVSLAAGEKGKLFGSVTSTDVVDYLHSQGMEIERKKVELPENGIKTVGSHVVKIRLYGGEETELKVNVSATDSNVSETPSRAKHSPKPEKEDAAEAPESDVAEASESDAAETPESDAAETPESDAAEAPEIDAASPPDEENS